MRARMKKRDSHAAASEISLFVPSQCMRVSSEVSVEGTIRGRDATSRPTRDGRRSLNRNSVAGNGPTGRRLCPGRQAIDSVHPMSRGVRGRIFLAHLVPHCPSGSQCRGDSRPWTLGAGLKRTVTNIAVQQFDHCSIDASKTRGLLDRHGDHTVRSRQHGICRKEEGNSMAALQEKSLSNEDADMVDTRGVALGVCFGAALYSVHPSSVAITLIGYPGEILIRALQELVLPLMVFALMSGVFNLRHSGSGTGRVIRWSLLYYLLSMILAVILGIALVYAIRPGRSKPFANNNFSNCKNSNVTSTGTASADKSVVDSLLNIGRNIIPTNIVAAAAAPNFLGVITFAIVFAAALVTFGERAEPLIGMLEICNDVFMKIIYAVIACTPVGIASLLASTILKSCSIVGLLKALALYVATVLGGFLIHSTVLLPVTLMILSQNNPFKVLRTFMPALTVGVGTSSSAATMPVTMKCGEDYGCAASIVRFVVPMGTNINRDGAALYEAVSVIFIVQAHGVSLSVGNVIVVCLTATLAAIGSASIPNSALVSMITVLQALSLQEYISDVAVLYSVDWLLGMFRTATNIWGDACACVIVDTWARRHAKKHGTLPIKNPDPPTEMEMGMESTKKDEGGAHLSHL